MSGVVNVWGGECLGGERLTIVIAHPKSFADKLEIPGHSTGSLWEDQKRNTELRSESGQLAFDI